MIDAPVNVATTEMLSPRWMLPFTPCGAVSLIVAATWPLEMPSIPPATCSPLDRFDVVSCSFATIGAVVV